MKHPRTPQTLRTSYRRLSSLLLICVLIATVMLSMTSEPASAETERGSAVPKRAERSAVMRGTAVGDNVLLRSLAGMAVQPLLLASTITVNSTDDAANSSDGKCTLREAITAANMDAPSGGVAGECAAGNGDDTITFDIPGAGPHIIQLTTALPDLSSNMTIQGPTDESVMVRGESAADPYRIFTINPGKTVSISRLIISNGRASGGSFPANSGGAIYINHGVLTVSDCTISGNSANLYGGAILNDGAFSSSSTLTITNSTMSGNSATYGAGIYNSGFDTGNAPLVIANSTMSSNNASLDGGGLYNNSVNGSGTATLTNVTITNNRADSDNDGTGSGGAIFNDSAGPGFVLLRNTIAAANFKGTGSTADDISGQMATSSSFNLIGTGGAGGLTNGTNNNQIGISDARLGPLANNGGPTQTHSPLSGSPAIDAGTNCVTETTHCGDPQVPQLSTDQRGAGFSRIIDGNNDSTATVDIGAFEAQDNDGDGVVADNCPVTANADQADLDQDGLGNVCDADDDNDGVADTVDDCPTVANADQSDGDSDGIGDACDLPSVVSIKRASANPTNSNTDVQFTVTFSEPVTGVDPTDFKLTSTGLVGPHIANVAGGGKLYTVTVNTGAGRGTLRLDVKDDDSIKDAGNDPLGGAGAGNGDFTSGEVYTVNERQLQFNSAIYIVGEADGHATITVTRVDDTTAPATVEYETSDLSGLNNCDVVTGNASARCDYTGMGGTLSFAAGQSSAMFTVPIINDVYTEGPETLTLTLSNPTGGALGTPSTATLIIIDNDLVPGAPNPIDNRAFFIRQNYLDFLNREPEPSGLADWLAILNNCPAGSIQCDDIEVSSDFFRSPEFFDRSYFVYRFYEVAFGRHALYDEYQRDIRKVSGFLTEAEKEARKQQFIAEFMSRQAFRDRYDAITDPLSYVAALEQTAGVHVSNEGQLISDLANGRKTRAEVLRAIVESPEASQKFYNKAFVVVGYFAYLRRDPDSAYLVWLNKLNTTGDYREMIIGFLRSTEYRARFGPA